MTDAPSLKTAQRGHHRPGRDIAGLMLPDAQDAPAGVLEVRVRLAVSLYVPRQLGAPIGAIGLGLCAMLRTAVPEAAVDEDGKASPLEDYVGSPSLSWQRRKVDSIPQACGVEDLPHGQLGTRVGPSVGLHGAPTCGGGRPRIGQLSQFASIQVVSEADYVSPHG